MHSWCRLLLIGVSPDLLISLKITLKCFNNNQLSHIPSIQPFAHVNIRIISLWNTIDMESHALLVSPSVECCFLPSVDLIENIVKCFDNNQLSHIPVTKRYSPTHIRMISLFNVLKWNLMHCWCCRRLIGVSLDVCEFEWKILKNAWTTINQAIFLQFNIASLFIYVW